MFAEPTGAPAVVLEKIGWAIPRSLLQLALAQGWFFCSLHLPFATSESTNFTIRKPSEQTKIIHILRHHQPSKIFLPRLGFFFFFFGSPVQTVLPILPAAHQPFPVSSIALNDGVSELQLPLTGLDLSYQSREEPWQAEKHARLIE